MDVHLTYDLLGGQRVCGVRLCAVWDKGGDEDQQSHVTMVEATYSDAPSVQIEEHIHQNTWKK